MTSTKFIQNKTALITLIAACLVVLISLGVRQTFGLFFSDFKNDLDISLTESGVSCWIADVNVGFIWTYIWSYCR